jgi:hypothetical protein
MIAVLVDLSRISTYVATLTDGGFDPAGREGLLVLVGTVAALAGVLVATRFLGKVSIGGVRYSVAALMFIIGAALAAGLIGHG